LDIAVKNEDFLLAIKLRDTIKDLEKNEGLINELQEKLKSHIEKQEFEEAIKVRDELKKYE
jgi:protein-arginine kinase activator protein McsA